MRFGRVDENPLAWIVSNLGGFLGKREVTDDRVMQHFGVGVVEFDVVSRPTRAELSAARRHLADQIGQSSIVRIATGLSSQDGDGVMSDGVPRREEVLRDDMAPISGTKRVGRVEENSAADGIELTAEQLVRLNDLPAASGDHHNEAQMLMIER